MRTLPRKALLKALVLAQCTLLAGLASAQEVPDATPAGPGDTDDLEMILVTGRRAADRLALEDKHKSDNQIDSIRADDVGRLPDQNVAEAVRRMPGVHVSNDQGEGRYLTVRGVSPDMLNVTLNGQTAPAPEPDGRQVKLDDIPSALIGAVTLVKTLTPDLDANAIAGQVNIQTLTAFDRNRNFATARAAYGYYDLNSENPYEFDLTGGGLFGPDQQFGVVLAVNHSDRKIGSQQFAGAEDWITPNGFEVPEEYSIRHYTPHRKRSGAVGNFDWQPNDRNAVFLRLVHSVYKDDEIRHHFGFDLDDDDADYFDQTATSGSFSGGGRGNRRVRLRREDTSTTSVSLGGESRFGEYDDRILNVETTFSKGRKRDPRRDEWTYRSGSNIGGTYDVGSSMFTITPDPEAFDPAAYRGYQVRHGTRRSDEDLYQGRLDYQFPVAFGDGSWFKLGAKYINREKTNDEDRDTWRQAGSGTLTLDQALGGHLGPVFSRYPYGPTADFAASDAYFFANPGDFNHRTEDSLIDSLAADYRVRERISAAYVMTSLRFGKLGIIPGVRVEHTETDYAAKAITDTSTRDQGFDSFGSKDYTDVFPGLNLRYDASEALVLRAAVTTAIGRPNYEDTAPFIVIEDEGNDTFSVTMGNPRLDALTSINYDIAAEYYVGNRGLVSVAGFYKDIDNPIFWTRERVFDGSFAGRVLPEADVRTPINAGSARVSGVELNTQYELSFLPAPLDGFGVGASITFVSSKASGVPDRPGGVPLLTQSDRVASFQVNYEKHGFAARVAYTYRSEMLHEVGSSRESDLYTDRFRQWDARASYAFSSNLTVFLEGANLNNAPFRQYYGRRNHLSEDERYGWSSRAGVQLSF